MAEQVKTGTAVPADAGHSKFPPLDPATFAPQLFWLALTFGALFVLLTRLVLPRISEVIGERKTRIDRDLAEAKRIKAETETAIADYDRALGEARARAQKIAQEARDVLNAEIARERAGVEARIGAKAADAERQIQAAKVQAVSQIDEIATSTARAVVAELIGSEPSADEVARVLAKA